MDVGYLKIRIDIKTEYDEYKAKYESKKKELKKDEIKKVFDGFKDFFRNDGHFKFKETDHTVTAEYKDHGVTLDIDIYKNIDDAGFNIEGTIKTFDKEEYVIVAEGVANKDMALESAAADEHERMLHQTRFFKDFLDGELFYTFRYRIQGREEAYASMQALMVAL